MKVGGGRNIFAQAAQFILKYWLPSIFVGLILTALSLALYHYSLRLDPNAAGANGLVLSAWGLLVSLAGFTVTFWQLAKTKSAAEAAAEAIQDTKSRVAAYDAIAESSRAATLIRETQRHLKVPSWESAAASYSSAREALIRLIELPSSITEKERAGLSLMLADIALICDRIDSGLMKQKVIIDRGKALRISREHEETVMRIGIALQRETLT